MNRTSQALVADYATARTVYEAIGSEKDLETMLLLREVAAILWNGQGNLDEAADHYITEICK